jgi:hypothetical protein
MFSSMFGGSAKNSAGRDNGEDSEDRDKDETEDEKKNEHLVVMVTRAIRNKMISRKLVGSIMIHRISAIISTRMHCMVKADDPYEDEEDFDPMEELSGNYKRAITTTDAVLNSLERRSRAWAKVDFSDDVSLTRGATIGVSDPIVGLIAFSFTFEITATVKSLLASRRRFETARESIALTQPPRGMSFSFSFSSSTKNNNATNNSNNQINNERSKSVDQHHSIVNDTTDSIFKDIK